MPRKLLYWFSTDNPVYGRAQISVFITDPLTNSASTEMARLYSDPFSPTELGNPIRLTGRGRWPQPVYVDGPVIVVAEPARGEAGAGVLNTYLENNPPPPAWGDSPG